MAKRQRRKRQERRRQHSEREGLRLRRSVITGVGLAAGATLGLASGAQAAPYYVGTNSDTSVSPTDCSDPGNTDCTLRDAVEAANTHSGYTDSVYFTSNVTGTVTLNGEISITDPVYIFGRGPGVDTISGDNSSRIFNINVGYAGDPVGIYSLKLTNGYAGNGGAIFNLDADLRVYNSFLTGNTATGNGGAIYNKGYDPYYGQRNEVTYSAITGNLAGYDGGGIYGWNSAGLIGTSTISGNHANGIGGGVSSYGPNFTYSSTLAGNSSQYAGGIANLNGSGYLYNAIVAGNSAPGQDRDLGHDFYAAFDLIQHPDTATLQTSPIRPGPNIIGVDPQLFGPALNGGDTPSLKPMPSSPVVDKGLSYSGFDQRGVPRPIDNPNAANAPGGDGGDIGSVELTLAEGPGPAPPVSPPTPSFNLKKAIRHCKKKFRHNHKKRKKCIKRAKRKARNLGLISSARARSAGSSSNPWAARAQRWAETRHRETHSGHHAFRGYRG